MKRMDRPILIYDGACPMCLRARDWVRAHTDADAIELMPCQSPERSERIPQVPFEQCMEAMVLVEPGGAVHIGEQAYPPLLRLTRDRKWLARLFDLPGMGILSPILYRWIAKHRLTISALFIRKAPGESCDIEQGCK